MKTTASVKSKFFLYYWGISNLFLFSAVVRENSGFFLTDMERWVRLRRAELINMASEAEKRACRVLKILGYDIIPQYPINTGRHYYFADIYIPALRLIVEIDGGYHDTRKQRRNDRNRSANIRRHGFHVCRLSNKDTRDTAKVRAKIDAMKRRMSR